MRIAPALLAAVVALASVASMQAAYAQMRDDACPNAASADAAYDAVERGRPNDARAIARTARAAAAAFERCGDAARSAQSSERLVGADVREGTYRLTLGTTLFRLGARHEAHPEFERALHVSDEAIETAKALHGDRAARLLRAARINETRARDAIEAADGAR
jgi:hypothetical protein